jgi:hypothetical protein
MTSDGAQRRFLAEVKFGPDRAAVAMLGGRAIYEYWNLLEPHYGQVLLAPQWRAAERRAAWNWQQPDASTPLTSEVLAEVRRKLDACSASASERLPAGLGGASVSDAVLDRARGIARELAGKPDDRLAGFVCLTTSGPRIHSWGAPAPGRPFSLDAVKQDIRGRVLAEGKGRIAAQIVLEDWRGIRLQRVQPDRRGRFAFPGLPSGSYRVRITCDAVVFEPSEAEVTLGADEPGEIVFRGARSEQSEANPESAKDPENNRTGRRWIAAAVAAILLAAIGFWKVGAGRRGASDAAASVDTADGKHWVSMAQAAARAQDAQTPAAKKTTVDGAPSEAQPKVADKTASEAKDPGATVAAAAYPSPGAKAAPNESAEGSSPAQPTATGPSSAGNEARDGKKGAAASRPAGSSSGDETSADDPGAKASAQSESAKPGSEPAGGAAAASKAAPDSASESAVAGGESASAAAEGGSGAGSAQRGESSQAQTTDGGSDRGKSGREGEEPSAPAGTAAGSAANSNGSIAAEAAQSAEEGAAQSGDKRPMQAEAAKAGAWESHSSDSAANQGGGSATDIEASSDALGKARAAEPAASPPVSGPNAGQVGLSRDASSQLDTAASVPRPNGYGPSPADVEHSVGARPYGGPSLSHLGEAASSPGHGNPPGDSSAVASAKADYPMGASTPADADATQESAARGVATNPSARAPFGSAGRSFFDPSSGAFVAFHRSTAASGLGGYDVVFVPLDGAGISQGAYEVLGEPGAEPRKRHSSVPIPTGRRAQADFVASEPFRRRIWQACATCHFDLQPGDWRGPSVAPIPAPTLLAVILQRPATQLISSP